MDLMGTGRAPVCLIWLANGKWVGNRYGESWLATGLDTLLRRSHVR